MYSFLRRPRWILSHVLVLALVVAMVNMGLWQLRRLHEKQDRNSRIESNSTQPAVSVGEFAAELGGDEVGERQYTRVVVRGTFDTAKEVAIRNRSLDGAPGRWVATPLRPADGGPAVLVVRGWIPQSVSGTSAPVAGVEPPAREVTVEGFVQPTEQRSWIGPKDPEAGVLTELARVDVGRVAKQYGSPMQPFWVQLASQDPATSGAITPVRLPALDEGPHFSYAVQWAIFTIIAIVGYPLILRRVARQRAPEGAGAGDGDDDNADDDGTDDHDGSAADRHAPGSTTGAGAARG